MFVCDIITLANKQVHTQSSQNWNQVIHSVSTVLLIALGLLQIENCLTALVFVSKRNIQTIFIEFLYSNLIIALLKWLFHVWRWHFNFSRLYDRFMNHNQIQTWIEGIFYTQYWRIVRMCHLFFYLRSMPNLFVIIFIFCKHNVYFDCWFILIQLYATVYLALSPEHEK